MSAETQIRKSKGKRGKRVRETHTKKNPSGNSQGIFKGSIGMPVIFYPRFKKKRGGGCFVCFGLKYFPLNE
jgi:hypothetical protein